MTLPFATDNTTIYFIKDIMARKKGYIRNDQVQTLFVPQYNNLSLERILNFVGDKPNISDFLPDDLDLPKVPKQWIVNVCAVVLGNEFRNWVAHQVEERNVLMCKKKEMMIAIDPQMAAKFQASTHVSRKYFQDKFVLFGVTMLLLWTCRLGSFEVLTFLNLTFSNS